MHGLLAAMHMVAEADPAKVEPSSGSSVIFAFLLLATVLLLWSFTRHLRRARANLGSSRPIPGPEHEHAGSPSSDRDRAEGESS